MSLLSYYDLCELVACNVITADEKNINGSSIDIRMGATLLVEDNQTQSIRVDVSKKQSPDMLEVEMDESGFILTPGEFVLAHSVEVFDLPPTITAEYKLKSSMARAGLQHLNAGHADPGWSNSTLTMEFKNVTRYHNIILTPGMLCGQMLFFRHAMVPKDRSYKQVGSFNNQSKPIASPST